MATTTEMERYHVNARTNDEESLITLAETLAEEVNQTLSNRNADQKVLFMEAFHNNLKLSYKHQKNARSETKFTIISKEEIEDITYSNSERCVPCIAAYDEDSKIMSETEHNFQYQSNNSDNDNPPCTDISIASKTISIPHSYNFDEKSQPTAEQKGKLKHEEFQKQQKQMFNLHNNPIQSQVANVKKHENISNRSNKKSINILLFGASGVGKSTFVNAFANYLFYDTLEEAIAAKNPICVIPTTFTIFDKYNQSHEVILGNDNNECLGKKSESATQNVRTYSFDAGEYDLNIIDTPGTNDTRGNEKNEENMKNILKALSKLDQLHAICLLFKPNESKLSSSFLQTLNSLLSNLSKVSLANICLIFTRSSSNFYKPGGTMTSLKKYFYELEKAEDVKIPINNENVFCLENGCFKFCCAYFGGVNSKDTTQSTHSESWCHSKQEVFRLIQYASNIPPINTIEALSINEIKTWVTQLIPPTIEANQAMYSHLQQYNETLKRIQDIQNNIAGLEEQLKEPEAFIETIPTKQFQIICKGKRCAESVTMVKTGAKRLVLSTVCHRNCNCPNLCNKITWMQGCSECSCGINDHIKVKYYEKFTSRAKEFQELRKQVAKENDTMQINQTLNADSKRTIENYKNEIDQMLVALRKFSLFLSKIGISQKYDMFENELRNIIEEESKKAKTLPDYDYDRYRNLQKLLEYYLKIRTDNDRSSLKDIRETFNQLCSMALTGQKVEKISDINVKAKEEMGAGSVIRYDKDAIAQQSATWFEGLTNLILSEAIPFL